MFGFGKNREYDVRLTEKEMRNLTKNMSRSERKDFEKRQRQAELPVFDTTLIHAEKAALAAVGESL